ncbi:hypothetical protein [Bartonella henselae]|uniref:hypothetical protein n=2 Tax=Bartonella henselae TaxID=38323 RepID=UPI001F343596|nr:hypothetical protein [Bartonella henselae]
MKQLTRGVLQHFKRVIENIIRKKRGSNELLMSDDVSIKALWKNALSKNFSNLTRKIFATGCDIFLPIADGYLEETFLVAHTAPFLKGKALECVYRTRRRVLQTRQIR